MNLTTDSGENLLTDAGQEILIDEAIIVKKIKPPRATHRRGRVGKWR